MKIIEIDEKEINGLSIRTNNANEMNLEKAKIGNLWQSLNDKVVIDYKNGNREFGVYYNYESDANGDFSVLAGSDQSDDKNSLDKVSISAGKYLVFEAKGEIPKVVIDTWGEIWDYFSKEDVEYERLYTTDFEYYKNGSEVEVCIAVK